MPEDPCNILTCWLVAPSGHQLESMLRRNEELGEMRLEGSMMAEEARVVQLIVAHLIAKENVLVVVEQPEQEDGEADAAYHARRARERVLAISPNYTEA